MEPKITYNSVYYVVTDNPEHFLDPIAIRPTFYEYRDGDYSERRCEWNDTSRGSHLFIKAVVPELTKKEESQPSTLT